MTTALTYWSRVRATAAAHPILAGLVALVLIYGMYWEYGRLTSTTGLVSYVVAEATTDTIVVSVSGTGQVAASNQLDIKPKASGEILSVRVKAGDRVQAGDLLAVIDPTQAQKAVRDAESSLASTKLSYEKLAQPADALSLTQAQNNAENAKTALAKARADAYDDVVATFLDLPTILAGLKDIVSGTTASHGSQWNIDYYKNVAQTWDDKAVLYRDDVYTTYTKAQSSYDAGFASYQATSQASSPTTITTVANTAYETAQAVSDALHSANTLLQFYEDQTKAHAQIPSTTADTGLTNLAVYVGKMNAHLSSLRSDLNTISSSAQNVTETTQSLAKVQAGADTLDLQSSQLSVQQRENALQDARDALADYYIRAPISGTIATFSAKLHDTAGSSSLGTIISPTQVANIGLNEVDVAKITVGDKVTMTFDALPDITAVGHVSAVDSVGTVSQGVVTYNVQISFDSKEAGVKPGMSVSASIVTDVKQDALVVPGAAVKTQGAQKYVQTFTPALVAASSTASASAGIPTDRTPTRTNVETGLSNDTETEIISGLTEGTQVVVRSITQTTSSASTQAPSLLQTAGGNRNTSAAGATRALGR